MVGPARGPREYLTRVPVRTQSGLLLIPTSQVLMIVAHGERLTITTSELADYSFEYRLKNLEARLDPGEFLRLGRSIIINLASISRIIREPNGTYRVVLENGRELEMSRKQAVRRRRSLSPRYRPTRAPSIDCSTARYSARATAAT
jgi:two-component system, LytTR family, response regulator